MQLNKCKLINALANINNPSLSKKRSWDKIYNNKTFTYWSYLIWEKILENESIFGTTINKYEFYNFCSYYCSDEESNKIFNNINLKSRCIDYLEFENFLEKIDDFDFIKIIESLELEKIIEETEEDLIDYWENEIFSFEEQEQKQELTTILLEEKVEEAEKVGEKVEWEYEFPINEKEEQQYINLTSDEILKKNTTQISFFEKIIKNLKNLFFKH